MLARPVRGYKEAGGRTWRYVLIQNEDIVATYEVKDAAHLSHWSWRL